MKASLEETGVFNRADTPSGYSKRMNKVNKLA